jgi:hypothetical protein
VNPAPKGFPARHLIGLIADADQFHKFGVVPEQQCAGHPERSKRGTWDAPRSRESKARLNMIDATTPRHGGAFIFTVQYPCVGLNFQQGRFQGLYK